MMPTIAGPVAYIMKRYPRLTETFILNEILAMERLGADLHIFSLLPPEPPPHHPAVQDVMAPVTHLPVAWGAKLAMLGRAHKAAIAAAPLRYLGAAGRAAWWSVQAPRPLSVWKQFIRGGFFATQCRQSGIRHIHAHFANAPAAVARFASLMTGIPYSFTTHAKDLYLTPKRVIQRRTAAATFVATCTGYNANYLREILPEEDRHKVNLVYHGIDLSLFTHQADQVAAAGRVPVIMSVGRLVPKKGLDDLVAACALMRDRGIEFRCLIIGEGPLRNELQADINRHNLAGHVELRGAMTHAKLIALYREASIFALPPRITEDGDRDGIPNVIVEAMATGLPVVSTAVSGIPELVKHDLTGLLVPPNDPKALAAALQRLLADPRHAQQLAHAARGELERNFDCWENTKQLRSLIDADPCCRPSLQRAPRAVQPRWVSE
jgi:glycosyltransferase involved in cell wall biosynthesis